MANLIIQENGSPRTTPAVNGEEITIQAPCDCSAVTGVQINDVAYPFYDAAGNSLEDTTGMFIEGSLIRVMIDTVNTRAYLLNAASSGGVFIAEYGVTTKEEIRENYLAGKSVFCKYNSGFAVLSRCLAGGSYFSYPLTNKSLVVFTNNTWQEMDMLTPASIGAAPAYTYGTDDLTAGTSELETGKLYFVYE